jgi:hypothetical protein
VKNTFGISVYFKEYTVPTLVINRDEKQVGVKMTIFWDVAPYSLVEIDGRFRGACCLHHQGYRPATSEKTVIYTCCRENLKSH